MTAHVVTCHCGVVELRIEIDRPLDSARRCDCSLCRRKGTPMLGVPIANLDVVKGAENLGCYSFNTRVAQHYFCKTCGIYTHHKRRSNPNEFGVNLGAIEGVNPRDFEPVPWNDGVNHPKDREGAQDADD